MRQSSEVARQAAATTSDPRWSSILTRDSSADGTFYYSVQTTGVYCLPSCASRRALPGNVRFHASPEAAEQAGFRPCQRCRPSGLSLAEQNTEKITAVCRLLEQADTRPSMASLAAHASMSVFHFHRTFKATTGLTPNQYAAAHRAKRLRENLGKRQSVTTAMYEAGFHASSRFYETSNQLLGMTPTTFRDGGADTAIHFAIGECSLGSILVASTERGVCAVLLGDDPSRLAHDLQDQFPRARLVGGVRGYEETVSRVIAMVENPRVGLDLPLDIRGTAFQQRVWRALQNIPVGSTATYTDIAKLLGVPAAVRAVAQACGANTLAVAIPCHRVVRKDGSLSGYRWGVERKQTLLEREAKP